MDFFFTEPGVEVNELYYSDILLSQQTLAGIKYVAGDNFVFKELSY